MPVQSRALRGAPDVDRLIVDHLPLARSLALRYRDRGVALEDLVQVANLALVKAGRRYRNGLGQSFAAYAAPTIAGELRRHFRDHGWQVRPPRRLQELQRRLREAENDVAQSLGRSPTSTELAERLGVAHQEVLAAESASRAYTATSLDELEHPQREDILAPVDEYDDVLRQVTLRPLLEALPARDRRIIALRFFDDATQAEIGREIGVTQMQVSRLLRRAIVRMRVAAGVAAA